MTVSEGKGSPNRCVLSAIRRWAELSEAGCPGGECSRDEGADKRAGGVEEEGGGGRPERTGGWVGIERFCEFRASETTEGFEGEGGGDLKTTGEQTGSCLRTSICTTHVRSQFISVRSSFISSSSFTRPSISTSLALLKVSSC